MHTKILVVGQMTQHCIGNGANAHLQRCTIAHKLVCNEFANGFFDITIAFAITLSIAITLASPVALTFPVAYAWTIAYTRRQSVLSSDVQTKQY